MNVLNCFTGGCVSDHVHLSFSLTEQQRYIIYQILQNYEEENSSSSSFSATTLTCEHYFKIQKVLDKLQSINNKDDSSTICEKGRKKILEHKNQRYKLTEYFKRVIHIAKTGDAAFRKCKTVKNNQKDSNDSANAEVNVDELQSKLENAVHLLKTTTTSSETRLEEETNENLREIDAFKLFKETYLKACKVAENLFSALSLCVLPPLCGFTAEGGANENKESLQSTINALVHLGVHLGYDGSFIDFFCAEN